MGLQLLPQGQEKRVEWVSLLRQQTYQECRKIRHMALGKHCYVSGYGCKGTIQWNEKKIQGGGKEGNEAQEED